MWQVFSAGGNRVSVTAVRPPGRLSRLLVWVAGAAGVLHSAASSYWALGGQWLLATVGQWAVELFGRTPLRPGLATRGTRCSSSGRRADPVPLVLPLGDVIGPGRGSRDDGWAERRPGLGKRNRGRLTGTQELLLTQSV